MLFMWEKCKKFWNELNLATKITMARIGLVVPVILFLSFPNRFFCFLACLLFGIASATDFVDGYIARRDQTVTTLGKFLDPLADKLLNCAAFIQLAALGWIPAWVVSIIVIRELAVTGLRAVASDEGIVIAADKYGKMKTIFQALALGTLIFHYPLLGINFNPLGYFLLTIAFFLTVFSGYKYFQNFYFAISKNEE